MTARLRDALVAGDRAALLQLSADPQITDQKPSTLVALGAGLRHSGAVAEAVELLKAAQQHDPGDFWLNLELGTSLMLWRPAEPRDALPYFTAALALSNRNPGVYVYLGNTQVKAGKLSDAEVAYRQAITLKPDLVAAHINLGHVLNELGKLSEGEKILERAAQLQPESYLAFYNLGLNRQRQGRNQPAVLAYRRAITIKPDYAEALNNCGNALTSLGRFEEAMAALEQALVIQPGYSLAHFNRGCLLDRLRKFDDAIDSYRKAIQYRPDHAEACYQIAFDLTYELGRFDEAETELLNCLNVAKAGDPVRASADRLLTECRRLVKLEPRLDAYLRGETKPGSAAEACDLARLCAWPHRRLFGEAALLYEQAFSTEPARAVDLRQGYRYFAATCAARAACGRGLDRLDSREQALARSGNCLVAGRPGHSTHADRERPGRSSERRSGKAAPLADRPRPLGGARSGIARAHARSAAAELPRLLERCCGARPRDTAAGWQELDANRSAVGPACSRCSSVSLKAREPAVPVVAMRSPAQAISV